MIKAIIFDFDGVILESAGIKTAAFRKLFERDHPDQVDKIVDYHNENMGISRYIKFRYIYKNILKEKLDKNNEKQLGYTFSKIVLDEILRAPFVPGAEEFLKERHKDLNFFIASGTPFKELLHIVKKRKLAGYFVEIHGSPETKEEIVLGIMKKYNYSRGEVVFIGDARSDINAAKRCRIDFILRVTDENKDIKIEPRRKIADLRYLSGLLDTCKGKR